MDQDTILKLLLEKVTSMDSKLDLMKERLHAGDRRMDEFEREIDHLKKADQKTDADVAVLKGKVATLEPVVEIVSGIKKLVYGGLAMVFIIVIGSQVVPYLLKSKIG